ncbi:MAG: DUF5684 domain-containing protein [Xenococcus sp. (in: cyanobacteria)]
MDQIISFFISLLQLAVFIIMIAGTWKIFEKAGQPGWAILIPIYNFYVLLKVAGRSGWWLIIALIPLINLSVIVICIIMPFNIANKFGKGIGYGFGLLFLPFVFYPILGFGNARYRP